jgi:hypothetical protein
MISSSQERIARVVEHECDEFIRKPIIKELLLKRVGTLSL